MKKITCLVLALLMCLTAVSAVADTLSKTVADMVTLAVVGENLTGSEAVAVVADEAAIEACNAEIAKMAAAANVETYFATVADAEGATFSLRDFIEAAGLTELMAAEELNIFECAPIVATGFAEGCGDVTVNVQVATPYEVGEQVVAMVGFTAENGEVEWVAFPGEGVESADAELTGAIAFTMDEATILRVQSEDAMLAVVSD